MPNSCGGCRDLIHLTFLSGKARECIMLCRAAYRILMIPLWAMSMYPPFGCMKDDGSYNTLRLSVSLKKSCYDVHNFVDLGKERDITGLSKYILLME